MRQQMALTATTSMLGYMMMQVISRSARTGKDTSFDLGVDGAGTYYVGITTADFHKSEQYGLTVSAAAGSVANVETESNDTRYY